MIEPAIIYNLKTKLTQNIYPLKINEYLAAGLPVIAVNFSSDIKSFNQVAYIEDSHEGFLDAIRSAIKENTPERVKERMGVASKNSWTAPVEKFSASQFNNEETEGASGSFGQTVEFLIT